MKRRDFLKTVSLVSAGFVVGCKTTPDFYQPQLIANKLAIKKEDIDVLGTVVIEHQDDVIGVTQHNDGTYQALSKKCSHMKCTLSTSKEGFICPCHGATFDNNGVVTKGPAQHNLTRYNHSEDAHFVYVDITR